MRYQINDGSSGAEPLFDGEISPTAAQRAAVAAHPSAHSVRDRIRLLAAALITEIEPLAAADHDRLSALAEGAIELVEVACILAADGISRRE
jgi:hypothetical protein